MQDDLLNILTLTLQVVAKELETIHEISNIKYIMHSVDITPILNYSN